MFYKPFQNVLKRTRFFKLSLSVATLLVLGSGCNKKNDANSSSATITAFYFNGLGFGAIGEINEPNHTIAVDVKSGTDITALKATFVTTGVSVKVGDGIQVSDTTANDFTNPITYTVTAQNGSTQNYTVTVISVPEKYVSIPDANFRDYLKGIVGSAFGTGLGVNQLNIYDNSVTTLDYMSIDERNIADWTGIEYFVGLTYLSCDNNKLISLDVSKNTALITLSCGRNNLTSLDVSTNTALTWLSCDSNKLISLDVSKNTALTILYCGSNNLTSLDVSKNTALTRLRCDSNKLISLDVSKNTVLTGLSCGSTNLTSLDLSKNTALTDFSCYNSKLTALDISSQTGWGNLLIYSTPSVAGENPLTTLKVNLLEKDNAEVKKVKTNNPSCVISTYTNNSTEVPIDPNYTPQ